MHRAPAMVHDPAFPVLFPRIARIQSRGFATCRCPAGALPLLPLRGNSPRGISGQMKLDPVSLPERPSPVACRPPLQRLTRLRAGINLGCCRTMHGPRSMDYETVSPEEFGASLTGFGLNILVRDVPAQVDFLSGVFGMRGHRVSRDFAIL